MANDSKLVIPEEKENSTVPLTKTNGDGPEKIHNSTESSQHRDSTGRRPSRGLEILGIGATRHGSKSPRQRSKSPNMSRTRSPPADVRQYKYWMMVDWTPEVSLCVA